MDFAILVPWSNTESAAAELHLEGEDVSPSIESLDRLKGLLDSVVDLSNDFKLDRGVALYGRGASAGAEAVSLAASLLGAAAAVGYFYEKMVELRRRLKGAKRRCILSVPAIKLLIGRRLAEIFPADFGNGDVTVELLSAGQGSEDQFFAITDRYLFVAYGNAVTYTGLVDASGDLLEGELKRLRWLVDVETVRAEI